MTFLSEYRDPLELNDRLRDAQAVTSELVAEIVKHTCRRFPSIRRTEPTVQIERLIESRAWTDAALALIDLELPQWQVRRIAYDEGEWRCALSRARELPEWLDQAVEAHHADLPMALLRAFVDAKRVSVPRSSNVPRLPRDAELRCVPLCCENFA
jgi:hypothetical protein